MLESTIDALFLQMSKARSARYLQATQDKFTALNLYQLNGQVGAQLWVPLQHFEIILRNTIDGALSMAYGEQWMSNIAFLRTIKQHKRQKLQTLIDKHTTIDTQSFDRNKIIAELEFSFWEEMLSPKMMPHIWDKYGNDIFVRQDTNVSLHDFINNLYNNIKRIRRLRNRIAHHEPIFPRRLDKDWQAISEVIWHCSLEFYELTMPHQTPIIVTYQAISQMLKRQ